MPKTRGSYSALDTSRRQRSAARQNREDGLKPLTRGNRMPIPSAVLRENEELEEMIRERQAHESAPADAPEEAQDAAGHAEQVQEGSDTPQPVEAPQEAVETPVDPLRAELDRLNHKFSVLQGKYNSETRQLRQQLRDREAEIEQLKSTPQAVQRQATEPLNYDIPEDEYDEDVVRLAERVADAKTKQAMESLESKFAEMRQQSAVQQENQFYTDLASIVPDWRDIDKRDDWQKWLDNVDRKTGVPYQSLLEDAVRSRDAIRTASFFEDFLGEQQPSAPRGPSVSSQVVPRRGPSTPAPEKPTISLADWEAKADALSKGHIRDASTYQKLEAELDAAWREGRVVP